MGEDRKYKLPEPYEYDSVIGEGGGGIVIKAYDTELKKFVVLKKLKRRGSSEESRVEVDILKNLNHQFLPAVHGYKSFGGSTYTVMDFVDGKSIGAMLKEGRRFTEKEVVKYAIELCTALDYLHSRKIPVIHGDIKPDNIMIREDGDICLIDFNISGISKDGVGYTNGYTPGYGAPEQAEVAKRLIEERKKAKEKEESIASDEDIDSDETVLDEEIESDETVLDEESDSASLAADSEESDKKPSVFRIPITKRSDIFSVGATLYHMCTGEVLNPEGGETKVKNFGEGIVSIINKAIEKDPLNRYKDAGEMLAALRNIHKNDRRYKALQRRQFLGRTLTALLGIAGVFMVVQGKNTISTEETLRYNEYLNILESDIDDASFDEVYEQAVSLKRDEIDAYLIKATRIYESRDYLSCAEYIEGIIAGTSFYERERISELYYLLGNCYFEIEEYTDAERSLLNSLNYNANNDKVNADLAIVYAREGKLNDAGLMLDKVLSFGTDNDHISLVRGEIAMAEGKYDEAVRYFEEYNGMTGDDYEHMRAYVLINRALVSKGLTDENISRRIEYLENAAGRISIENRLMILSLLSQSYIDKASVTGDIQYETEALRVLEEIARNGWDTSQTDSNIIRLAIRTGDFEAATEYLEILLNRYPDVYSTYKLAALVELQVQNRREHDERDYRKFEEYYLKAVGMFSENRKYDDPEMQTLEANYNNVVAGNWLTDDGSDEKEQ